MTVKTISKDVEDKIIKLLDQGTSHNHIQNILSIPTHIVRECHEKRKQDLGATMLNRLSPDKLEEFKEQSYRYFDQRYTATEVSKLLHIDSRITYRLYQMWETE